ncbi:GTPase [Calderihabitans maritimus]|uniref:G domain-containing protein n=1 Tax=Calderihabitans maritimus TaxID=1246530 RepID=A0A1Z5HPN5_9FIRM|nr:GTPase [Calderihabitans maritimus]GAW91483.1 hypothetical protein KKC1_06450 [Calderihabitans maritimus]
MAKECLVIGQPNAGKTAFVLSFVESLGNSKITITFNYPGKTPIQRTMNLPSARKFLIGPNPHQTRCLQSVTVEIAAGKVSNKVTLIDTTGLVDSIHQELAIRKGMVQTLSALENVPLILHMIDVSKLKYRSGSQILNEVDRQLLELGKLRTGYVVLASKVDLPSAREGLKQLEEAVRGVRVIPVSSLTKKGMKEVIAFVGRNT